MEIIKNEDMAHVELKGFTFSTVGDISCANGVGSTYARIGGLTKFTFNKLSGSRRLFRVLCKSLDKKYGVK